MAEYGQTAARARREEETEKRVKAMNDLDVVREIHHLEDEIERLEEKSHHLSVRFYKPSDVAQFMDGVQPSPNECSKDIQWVKTLRERSGCTLREAVHAHDICAALNEL